MTKRPKSQTLLEGKIPMPWLLGVLAAVIVVFVVAVIAFSAVNRISTCETVPSHPARGRDVQAVVPLRRRCGLPAVPHQAGRVQLLHPQPAGPHQRHPVRLEHLRAAAHDHGGDQQLRAVPSQVAARARPGVQQHPRQPHGPARGRVPVRHVPRQHQPSGHAARGGARVPEQDAHLRALPRRRAAARRLQRLPRRRRPAGGDQRPHRGQAHAGRLRGLPPRQGGQGRLLRLPSRPRRCRIRRAG